MKVEDLMGSLHLFEINLKQRKRGKSITLKIVHEEEDSSEEDNDDELALLTNNFKKFLKKIDKSSKFGSLFLNIFKGKNYSKNWDFLNNKKRIQCREYEGFRICKHAEKEKQGPEIVLEWWGV